MKPCTIYGCTAAAPRNSKVCFEHIKAGLLRNPLEVSLDRGAPSFSVTNNTDKPLKISATLQLHSDGYGWTLDKLISHEMDNEILDNIIREANGLPPEGCYSSRYPPTTVPPTPGKSYRIRYGDTLLTVTGRAYGVSAGQKRLSLSQQVNSHRTNVSGGKYFEQRGPEGEWYPAPLGRLSFSPPYQKIYFPTEKEMNDR